MRREGENFKITTARSSTNSAKPARFNEFLG